MGAYLSAPVTENEFEHGESEAVRYACTSMQGWRTHQEDSHNCIPDYGGLSGGCSLFAVYDGHGGAEVAKYISARLPTFLLENGLRDALATAAAKQQSNDKDSANAAIFETLKKNFIAFDDALRQEAAVQEMTALREEENADKQKGCGECDEEGEEQALFEEAIALSEESSISLETIIRQYAVIRRRMLLKQQSSHPNNDGGEEEGEGDEEEDNERSWRRRTRSAKRVANVMLEHEPSSETTKRRKMQRENATTDGPIDAEEGTAKEIDGHTPSNTPNSGDEISKLNGTRDGGHNHEEQGNGSGESPTNGKHLDASSGGENTETAATQKLESNADSTHAQLSSPTASCDSPKAGPSSTKKLDSCSSDDGEEEDDDDYDAAKEEDDEEEGVTTTDEEEENTSDGGSEGGGEDEEDEKEEDEVSGEEAGDDEDEEEVEMNGEEEMGTKAGYDSGATACMALLLHNSRKIIVANVGDSRAVLCRDGKAVDLSVDHKPEDAVEKTRIEKAGGVVNEEGRVNGGLNLSRALGDHYYKKNDELSLEEQMITAMPDIVVINDFEPDTKDQLLVVACDGIWNSMTSQQVVDFVLERRASKPLTQIGAELCNHCLAPDTSGDGTGCDNMTVIIVDLNKAAGVPEKSQQGDGAEAVATVNGGGVKEEDSSQAKNAAKSDGLKEDGSTAGKEEEVKSSAAATDQTKGGTLLEPERNAAE